MDGRRLGLLVAALGVVVLVVGGLIAVGALSWFGRLPGDIRIRRDGLSVFIPITSMLLVSVVLSVVLAVLRRVL